VYNSNPKNEIRDVLNILKEIQDEALERSQEELDILFERYERASRFQYCKSGRK
jgi:hypothetical protein